MTKKLRKMDRDTTPFIIWFLLSGLAGIIILIVATWGKSCPGC
jgi:hypothetical protein|tara:strand:+ start:417 stop:545 length:129 start_codon:yes stop_codon:yes gene_type:complete